MSKFSEFYQKFRIFKFCIFSELKTTRVLMSKKEDVEQFKNVTGVTSNEIAEFWLGSAGELDVILLVQKLLVSRIKI